LPVECEYISDCFIQSGLKPMFTHISNGKYLAWKIG